MSQYVKMTISLEKEIDRKLRELAKKDDRNISSEITHLIKFYITNKKND